MHGIDYIDGLAQDCNNSSPSAMELLQSCTKPLSHVLIRWEIYLCGWCHRWNIYAYITHWVRICYKSPTPIVYCFPIIFLEYIYHFHYPAGMSLVWDSCNQPWIVLVLRVMPWYGSVEHGQYWFSWWLVTYSMPSTILNGPLAINFSGISKGITWKDN